MTTKDYDIIIIDRGSLPPAAVGLLQTLVTGLPLEKYGGKRETNRIICYRFFFCSFFGFLPCRWSRSPTRRELETEGTERTQCDGLRFGPPTDQTDDTPSRAALLNPPEHLWPPSPFHCAAAHRRHPASHHHRARVRLQLQPVTCSTLGGGAMTVGLEMMAGTAEAGGKKCAAGTPSPCEPWYW
jgi:hypothetical protein